MIQTLETGVKLRVLSTTKFKTVRMMVRFATPLNAETISQRTLLASLLETNSKHYETQQKLSEKLADLYGASFGINVTKKGNNHYLNVILNVVNDKFLPNQAEVLAEAVAFLNEIIFQPNITAGAFEETTFLREQKNLQAYIASVYDDKQSQAALALQELYFADSADQRIPSFGTVPAVGAISPSSLATYYQEMLAKDDVMITVIGDVSAEEMFDLFKTLPFTPRSTSLQHTFYHQPLKEIIAEKTEIEPVIQSKLNLAFQTGIYYHEGAYFPLQVFNGIFGGFPHSKLFMNVREKESMAYYAGSSLDTFRGLLTVQTGIEGKNKDRVLTLVEEQLEAIKAGQVTAEELRQTKEMLKNQYLLSLDNPSALVEAAYLKDYFPGTDLSDEAWLAKVDDVTLADVQGVAEKVYLQAIYFMEGGQS